MLDETAVYLVQDGALLAYALADGRLLWKRTLPPVRGRWQTLRMQNCLVVFPREGESMQLQFSWLFVTARVRFTFPPSAELDDSVCVLACDPCTGLLLQSLQFQAAPLGTDWHCQFRTRLNLAPRFRRERSPDKKSELTVQVSAHGLAVELNGRAWGLKTYGHARSVN
jgi:hypothetical protein